MLNFDDSHKTADMSSVKSKLEKLKIAGKALIGGVLIAGCILFGNYIGNQMFPNPTSNMDYPVSYSAVVENDDSATIVDLYYYNTPHNTPLTVNKTDNLTLVTPEGERIVVSPDAVTIFDGEDCHDKAEEYAQNTYENVVEYNAVQNQGVNSL